MVRLSRERSRRSHHGGILDRHGSWVKAAAVALRLGIDPIKFLSLEGLNMAVMQLVLDEAIFMRNKDEERRIHQIEIAVQNGVAWAFRG